MTLIDTNDPVNTPGRSAFPTLSLAESVDVIEMYETYGSFVGREELVDLGDTVSLVRDTEYRDRAIMAITGLVEDGWRYLGHGCTRVVFEHPVADEWVAKVPLDDRGVMQSVWESRVSEKDGKSGEIPIAECMLDEHELILWMERVTPLPPTPLTPLPDWTFLVDCCQVGYDSEGTLVAYDL